MCNRFGCRDIARNRRSSSFENGQGSLLMSVSALACSSIPFSVYPCLFVPFSEAIYLSLLLQFDSFFSSFTSFLFYFIFVLLGSNSTVRTRVSLCVCVCETSFIFIRPSSYFLLFLFLNESLFACVSLASMNSSTLPCLR